MNDRFEKFTERARKVLVLAQQEAVRFNHNYIGTEHLLLGVMAEGQGVGGRMLAHFGVDLPRLREVLTFIVGRGSSAVTGEISLTPRAKLVVDHATVEAQRLNLNYIGTEHLLLGVANPAVDGISVRMLEACGVDLDALRRATLETLTSQTKRVLGGTGEGAASSITGGSVAIGARQRDNVVTCRVDDQTLEALDALVEAGVHTTRSEAAARLILGGIQANQPLFKRVFDAVAEIRRVRAETQALARMWNEGGAVEPDGGAKVSAPAAESAATAVPPENGPPESSSPENSVADDNSTAAAAASEPAEAEEGTPSGQSGSSSKRRRS